MTLRRCWCCPWRLRPSCCAQHPSRPRRPPSGRPRRADPVARHAALTDKLNQNTVTVISGNPNGTYLYLAYDMSAVLDDGNDLRVLPVIGKGGYQNIMDVLHLQGRRPVHHASPTS